MVLGSGIAGLTFALRCAPHGRVIVVTKSELSDTNTSWAQGGVAAAVGEDDSWELHEEDTLTAGAGLCDPKAVRFLVQNARRCLEWLIEIGARFDYREGDSLPRLDLGREGGHSRSRIVHHADQSGREIERALTSAVRNCKPVKLMEYTFCDALGMSGGRCTGAFLQPKGQERMEVRTRATLLATGSCCRVYRFTTNPPIATGDGVGLASAVGARIENMEFIQFHPTVLYHRSISDGFLITEAVRGAGAILRTIHGRRFMPEYDERGELAPRDIVARAIHAEILKEGVPFVHLDMTHLPQSEVRRKFPTILEKLAEFGIDPSRDPIPVVPAAHYQCGGVTTDLRGRTSIDGLYASGEVACTGVHGANRLASNSLLEALVFSSSAAEDAVKVSGDLESGTPAKSRIGIISRRDVEGLVRRLRRVMWEQVGIVRSNLGLKHAVEQIDDMIARATIDEEFHVRGAEAANLLECARLITRAAKARKVNVGLHYNVDLVQHSEAPAGRETA